MAAGLQVHAARGNPQANDPTAARLNLGVFIVVDSKGLLGFAPSLMVIKLDPAKKNVKR